MADNPRLDPEACIVVDRAELNAAFDSSSRALDRLSYYQGIVVGLLIAALAIGALFLFTGHALAPDSIVFALATAAGALIPVYRLWDARATWLRLGYWNVAGFAAALQTQWESEVNGGRADG